jgi:hypothetical protein
MEICRDLGLAPDWSLWPDEDWAVEMAAREAASPGVLHDTPAFGANTGRSPPSHLRGGP